MLRHVQRLLPALLLGTLLATGAHGGERIDPALATRVEGDATAWYDARLLGVEGQGWSDTAAPYDRLPARAEATVREAVWGLSRHSAGLCVRFVTDATALRVKWKLTSASLAMPHMPATGVSGVDLYVRHEGTWRWLACGFPTAEANEVALFSEIPPGEREYRLYLPLYNGVSEVALGLPAEASLQLPPPYAAGHEKPLVFYGTSITQGGCASRPGMVHTAILGRRFERPVINLGFSGNGRLEPEVAELMAELDPAVFIVDCLPNVGAEDVASRTEPLVTILRAARPETPILLVEDRTYSNAFLIQSSRQRNDSSRQAFRAAYERLSSAGVVGLHYLAGEHLLGEDNEGTVDSSHPTDLGFVRQADAFEAALQPILSGE